MVCLWCMTTHKHTIRLSDDEVITLQSITKKGTHKARVVIRARILLLTHRGVAKNEVAGRLDIDRGTVQNIRDKYREGGLDCALSDAPRPGAPGKITEKVEAHLVAIACSDPPKGYDSWTLEMLRQRLVKDKKLESISTVAIWHHLRDRGIKPWRGKNVVRAETHA